MKQKRAFKITYSVDFLTYSEVHRAWYQNTAFVSGSKGQKLTERGIDAALRKNHPLAKMTGYQSFIDER